jgi:hypothetical protein
MPESLADVLSENGSLELDCIDRMYLNVYQPRLQRPEQVAWYIKNQLGQRFPSTVLLEPLGTGFVKKVETFAQREGIPVVRFAKGMRKDEMTQKHLAENGDKEGVLYIGIAQEKAKVVRTERRKGREGGTYPWLVSSTAMVNHIYFYCVDKDFGPFFLKFCTYFPFNGKLCLNGHEWLKRQLEAKKIRFEARTTGSPPVRTRRRCRPWPTDWERRTSTGCFGNGCGNSRIRSPRRTGRPGTCTICRSYRRSSRPPAC